MIDQLEEWDRELFLFLNGLHQPWLDQPMFLMTKAIFWLPVYLLFIYLITKSYNWKIMLWSLIGVALVVTLCDRISVEAFKEIFQRYRPSRNAELQSMVYIVNEYRGGLYGFVSSHATNFFGIATFVSLLLRKSYPKAVPWVFLWAALISYTRIYLGVHYPADILAGALLGSSIGAGVFLFFRVLLKDRIK